jgi:SRSO17 transposase
MSRYSRRTDTNREHAYPASYDKSRWSIEVAIEDAKQLLGTGQARNRTAAAVERTVPFQLTPAEIHALRLAWEDAAA